MTPEELLKIGFTPEQITSLNYTQKKKCQKCQKYGIGRSGLNAMHKVNMYKHDGKYYHKDSCKVI